MPVTSIIIPVHNGLDYTKTAIASIRSHTPEPYELIVVDNASSDDTPAYLAAQPDVLSLRSEQNLGHAGGTNVGIRASHGDYLVSLNNDAVVTERWLTNLLRCAESDERIGLVSPVTNYIGNPNQLLAVAFQDLEEMHRFAADFNQSDPRKWVDENPFGFCFLVKRHAQQIVGLLSEDNDLGLGDDIDYNERLNAAGYRTVLAKDTFVFHYGSRTFFEIWAERQARNTQP